jgi:hypothetical protein
MSNPGTNRLIDSTSPYLLQHAHNPVDWWPWGPEALARARELDRPIFLSIGYSACHWCHVMERESFEDGAVAGILNGHFVPIKVDREERPDLDELYMGAVQALTGRGGWPMSVWLTPELKPFYGGTYFPPTSRHGMPGFTELLEGILAAWRDQRRELESDAGNLAAALARQAAVPAEALADSRLPGPDRFPAALAQLRAGFDPRWGGFGPAPKFPPAAAIELILRRGGEADRAMAERTLDAMAAGGLFDHLGGGFARYSVDGQWLIPHFEKMLYDNAQLATCYLDAHQATGNPAYRTVARETLDYLLRDLRDPAGGFHSSEDADSEGEEGRFYVFTPGQVGAALGPQAGERFCQAFGITAQGNFEHGASVPNRIGRTGPEPDQAELDRLRLQLRAQRERRVRPGRDDKVVAAWNGLALTAFARGFQVLGEPGYLEAAEALAAFLVRDLFRDGVLARSWRRGAVSGPGFLEDYAAVAAGLTDLYEAGFDPSWLGWAAQLADSLRERFEDPAAGGFFSSQAGCADLLFRQKPTYDGVIPSGNTLAARALLKLAGHLDRPDFRVSAEGALRCAGPLLAQAPTACLGLLGALDLALDPLEVVISGDPEAPGTQALVAAARSPYLPNRLLTLTAADPALPLHRGRHSGVPAAFVCRNRACSAPVATPEELERLLKR